MVAVLGAGSWGTALAIVLADNGHDVRLWGQRQEQIDEINEKHMNEKYLPNIHLPEAIVGYVDLAKALEGVETVVLAVPTKAIRDVLQRVRTCVKQPITIVSVSKGIEPDTHKRISEIIEEEMPAHLLQDVVVLS